MFFTFDDVRRSFDPPTLTRARECLTRGRILDLRIEDRSLAGIVAGTAREPYQVSVDVMQIRGERMLTGMCSCPVRTNCKHAAAAALSALSRTIAAPFRRDAADGAVDSWMEMIAAASVRSPKQATREHLRYTIEIKERYYVPYLHLAAYVVPILKNGGFGSARLYELHNLASGSAKQLVPIDRTIGRLVQASGLVGSLAGVSPTVLATLIDVLVGSGRVHWRTIGDPALQRGPAVAPRIAWSVDDDGRQRPHLEQRPATVLIASAPLWYVDTEQFLAGPTESSADPELLALLATAPALTPEQAKRAQIALRHVFVSAGTDGPQAAIDVRIVDSDPIPLLRLRAYEAPKHTPYGASESFGFAELQFAYGERTVLPRDPAREFRDVDGTAASTWPRRLAFEQNALTQLQDVGLVSLGFQYTEPADRHRTLLRLAAGDDRRWIPFLGDTVPLLERDGWRVEIDPSFPYTIVESGPEWHAQLTPTEERWFALDLGIDVDGQRVPLLPILIEALAANGIGSHADLSALASRTEPIYGKLPSGAYVALPAERIARVLAILADLLDGSDALSEDGSLSVAPVQAASIADLGGVVRMQGAGMQSMQALVDELSAQTQRKVATPAIFKATLRPYQHGGLVWLQALREHGFGGVLADDMGLGKTVQLLAHIAVEKAAGRLHAPVLIVAPTSVVPNWRAEIARFVPSLRAISLTGPDRADRFAEIAQADLALTTYALLPRDADHLLDRTWSIAVLDEAQSIKNPRAKAALAAVQLRADQRLAMTGTPIENHLEELWSIYAFAVPGLLGERARFSRLFRAPIEKHNDTLRRSALAARLRPFLLRRTKEGVAAELPAKTEIVHRVELAGAQRDLYETIRLAMHKRVRDEVARRGLARSRIVVLDALLKLRQVCCDPRLVKLPRAATVKESQKLDALLEMLDSLMEDGRRVLLFSQFTSMLDLMKPELVKRRFDFVELRGDTRDRETPVQRFQRGEVPLFLISLKAGGTGLNLTAADTVIHYDPWWNPAVERQATDRAHRIGQDKHVFVYKLIAEGTVEERILEMQERKGALAASLFGEAATAPLRLGLEDIERLFS